MDFDDLLCEVGEFGGYQFLLLLLLCLPAGVPCAFYSLNLVFIQASPDHWCQLPTNTNLTVNELKSLALPHITPDGGGERRYSQCTQYLPINHTDGGEVEFDGNETMPCTNWQYNLTYFQSTIVTEWDLVCSRDWVPSLIFALFNTGSLLGNFMFGYVQDKYGRKIGFFSCLTLQVISGITASLSVDPYMFMSARFLLGLTVPSILNAPLLTVIEMVGPSKRTLVTLLVCLFYSLSIILIPLVSYILPNWQHFSLATSAPFAIFLLYWWIMPESPRWLLSKQRLDDASFILFHMARRNGRDVTLTTIQQTLLNISTYEIKVEETTRGEAGFLDLFKRPNLLKKVICITVLWSANVIVYIGLSYYIPVLSGSPHLNFLFAALAELPAYPILYLVLDRWGRRWPISLSMSLSGLACISAVLLPSGLVSGRLILTLVGKVFISCSFVINYIYSAEIYPTVVRGIGLGFSSFIAGIGGVGLPFIIYLGIRHITLPVLIMGCVAVFGGVAGSFLPETLHQHLPQTLEDGERFGKEQSYCQCLPHTVIERNIHQQIESDDDTGEYILSAL